MESIQKQIVPKKLLAGNSTHDSHSDYFAEPIHSLRSTFYVLRSTFYVLRSTFYVLRSTFYAFKFQVVFLCVFICSPNLIFSQNPNPAVYNNNVLPACMTTNVLDINTGMDWIQGTPYLIGSQDEYWCLDENNNGPDNICATVYSSNCGLILSGTQAISVVSSGNCAENANIGGLMPGAQNYLFVRYFWVDAPSGIYTATFNLDVVADDRIWVCSVNGSPVNGVTTGALSACTLHSFNFTKDVYPGLNYLLFNINNIDINMPWEPDVPSPMYLDVRGTISYSSNIFVNNKHFKGNSSSNPQPFFSACASNAYVTPILVNNGNCLPIGSTFGTVVITNYSSEFEYTLDGNALSTSTFTVVPNSAHSIVVDDSRGCSFSKTVHVNEIPTITVSPTDACWNSMNSPISITPDGVAGPFSITNLTIPSTIASGVIAQNSVTSFLPAPVTIYTIQVEDASGCTTVETATFRLMTIPSVGLPPPICFGQSTIIQVGPVSCLPTGTLTYAWLPAGGNTNPTAITPSATSNYTCTITSTNGCTVSTTVPVIVNDNPIVTVTSNNAPCSPSFTASINTTLTANYNWSGVFGTQVFNGVTTSTVYAPGPTPPILQSGTYTVSIVDANGCTGSYKDVWQEKPFCCNSQQLLAPGTKAFSSNPGYLGNNSSAIITAFASSTITSSNYILFDGDIYIDQSLNFINCSHIRFDPNCLIHVTNGATLRFTNCVLDASCDYMWNGIIATSPNEKIILQNSTIRGMNAGVVLVGGAKIDVADCIFQNNFISIELNSTPSLYNIQTGNCSIIRSLFESDGLSNLLPPHSNQLRGENGIRIVRPRNAEIGRLVNDEFNVFRNLYCGINIIQHSDNTPEFIKLNNNKFENIQDETTLTSNNVSDFATAFNWGATNAIRGCAVHAAPLWPVPTILAPTHRVNIHYLQDMSANIDFYNCDKAVVGHHTRALIDSGIVDQTLLGYMFQNAGLQQYNIAYNRFGTGDQTKIFRAVYINSNNYSVCNRYIHDNIIRLRDQPLSFISWIYYPIGIFSNTLLNTGMYQQHIYKNNIGIFSEAGVGIHLSNGNNLTSIRDNTIHIFSGNPAVAIAPLACGIHVTESKGVQLTRNKVIGNTALIDMGATSNFECIRVNNSQDGVIECNDLKWTKFGLTGYANCHTGFGNVRGNKFTNHWHGIKVLDLAGAIGTFGDIGNLPNDNNNAFSQAGLSGGFSVYHEGPPSLNNPGYIYTSPFNLSLAASGASVAAQPYAVQSNTQPNSVYSCPSFPSSFASILPGSFDYDYAMDIINDSIEFSGLPDNLRWASERDLYEDLFNDSTLRSSSSALQQYYNDQSNTGIGMIVRVNALMQLMSDSTVVTDSIALSSIMMEMETINNGLMASNNSIERNEYFVNRLFIQWGRYGSDEISSADSLTLDSLAASCPYDAGPAVHKARTLYSLIDPTRDYNDWAICHANGLYKGIGDENTDTGSVSRINDDLFTLYPNPASTEITVEYNLEIGETANLSISDMTGRVRKIVSLYSFMNRVIIPISDLERGSYLYQFKTKGSKSKTGKLIIQ